MTQNKTNLNNVGNCSLKEEMKLAKTVKNCGICWIFPNVLWPVEIEKYVIFTFFSCFAWDRSNLGIFLPLMR